MAYETTGAAVLFLEVEPEWGKTQGQLLSRIGCRGWGAGPSFPLCQPEGRASGGRREVLDQERETSSQVLCV